MVAVAKMSRTAHAVVPPRGKKHKISVDENPDEAEYQPDGMTNDDTKTLSSQRVPRAKKRKTYRDNQGPDDDEYRSRDQENDSTKTPVSQHSARLLSKHLRSLVVATSTESNVVDQSEAPGPRLCIALDIGTTLTKGAFQFRNTAEKSVYQPKSDQWPGRLAPTKLHPH